MCVLTYKRVEALRRALRSLLRQRLCKAAGRPVRIIVVDNDSGGSARETVERLASRGGPFPVQYLVEAVRGIPQARNAAVHAAGDCECIAFIDDDEVACPRWLDELLHARQASGAPVVVGPVWLLPPRDAPRHVADAYRRHNRHHAGPLGMGLCTGNILFDAAVLRTFAGPFDGAMALTGASDTELGLRMRNAGVHIHYCRTAAIMERVTRERMAVSYLLEKAFRSGNSLVLCYRRAFPGRLFHPRPVLALLRSALYGLAWLAPCIAPGKSRLLRAGMEICRAAGVLAGLCGYKYQIYLKER